MPIIQVPRVDLIKHTFWTEGHVLLASQTPHDACTALESLSKAKNHGIRMSACPTSKDLHPSGTAACSGIKF